MPENFETFNKMMQAYADHCQATRPIPESFTTSMLEEQSKLPYEKHADDGQYNDGQIMGFQLGAEWAYRNFCEAIDSKPRSDFDVMAEMASKNMNIRMSPHFVGANLANGGAHVTMGVDTSVLHDLLSDSGGKWTLALYVIDFEQFYRLKNLGK